MKNDATFVRMRSGDHLRDAKMSKKGTSLRRFNFFNNCDRQKRFSQNTAIPLPIKLYVALRVGVAVILSQRPTTGTIEYSTNRFCGETYVLAGVLKSQVFKLCFGAKSFVLGKRLAKLRKEEDR